MQAGRELDRVIAEALGWHELKAHQYWHEDYDDQGTWFKCWQGIPPEGTELPWGTHVLKVPDFSTDANADLHLAEGEWLEIHEGWTGHTAARVVRTVTGQHGDWQEGTTLSEARARARLDWHDKQK